jgi:hypothetical protein
MLQECINILRWAWTAKSVVKWIYAWLKTNVYDRKLSGPVFALNRRIRAGFRWNRSQPDPNPQRFRVSDGIGPWPRFNALDVT